MRTPAARATAAASAAVEWESPGRALLLGAERRLVDEQVGARSAAATTCSLGAESPASTIVRPARGSPTSCSGRTSGRRRASRARRAGARLARARRERPARQRPRRRSARAAPPRRTRSRPRTAPWRTANASTAYPSRSSRSPGESSRKQHLEGQPTGEAPERREEVVQARPGRRRSSAPRGHAARRS